MECQEYREHYLLELCVEVARGNVGGERFNDLLLKTGVLLDDYEWQVATRLLEETEKVDCLRSWSTALVQ